MILSCAFLTGALGIPVNGDAQTLGEVVVSASRSDQRSYDEPAAVQAVGRDAIDVAGPQVNLSEPLSRIPGVTVLNRQNYAQDLQLSIRGFGSRSTFGIRGVRLIVDGIPATMPDGQGQASTAALSSAGRIEVLRGPLAQLYGNAAGGVVQVFTEDGPSVPTATASLYAGAYGLRNYGVKLGGESGKLNYLIDYGQFETDGYRVHSLAERRQLNAKLRYSLTSDTRVTVVGNFFDQPLAEDPAGLTRAQYEADPRQVVANVLTYDAGKTVSQNQLGVALDHRLDADRRLIARAYVGQRDLYSRLSIPIFVQTAATAAGGAIDLDRGYFGVGLQYSHRFRVGQGAIRATIGVDRDQMKDLRRGYLNTVGVQGALKRDEDDRVSNTDVYAQANWLINADWSAVAGLRSSQVRFRVDDRFIAAGNPDDSGSVSYSATNPVVGITRHFGEVANVYVNFGRGFETPTFTEIAYTSGGSGLNLGLEAARSRHAEIGIKTRLARGHRLDIAAFRIDTEDEIVVDTSSGGRTTYKNASRTRRTGVELAYSGRLTKTLRTHVALTALEARFSNTFVGGGGATVADGNRIPGIASRSVYAELDWHPGPDGALAGLNLGLELVHRGKVHVDDVNSDAAEATTVFNLRAGLQQRLGNWTLREFARIENATDRRYAGSVIVNEGNSRFFEGAPGRSWMIGVTASYAFR